MSIIIVDVIVLQTPSCTCCLTVYPLGWHRSAFERYLQRMEAHHLHRKLRPAFSAVDPGKHLSVWPGPNCRKVSHTIHEYVSPGRLYISVGIGSFPLSKDSSPGGVQCLYVSSCDEWPEDASMLPLSLMKPWTLAANTMNSWRP